MALFEPRIGIIADPFGDGKTSIRASFGMFYDSPQMFFNTRYSNSPPYGDAIAENNVSFANPWAAYPGGDPFPGLNTLSATAPFAQEGVYVFSPLHIQPFYLEQWNLSIQRQLGSWLIGATYLGNRSLHLPTSYEADPALYHCRQLDGRGWLLRHAGGRKSARHQARRVPPPVITTRAAFSTRRILAGRAHLNHRHVRR
jgi:hypothetical protein